MRLFTVLFGTAVLLAAGVTAAAGLRRVGVREAAHPDRVTAPVSEDHLAALRRYIAQQPEHHAGVTLAEEFRGLLLQHVTAFDERCVWD